VLDGWPLRRHDTGRPCQPDAFAPGEQRLAYVEGVSVLPKSLAHGLDVELQAEVMTLEVEGGAVRVHTSQDKHYEAGTVVLALAPEQTRRLLESLPQDDAEIVAAREMLGLFASVRCVTLLAGYQRWSPEPPWDVSYPSDSTVLSLISNESSKRPERKRNAIVYQASPRWSRAHFDEPVAELEHALISEASRLLGAWAGEPSWTQVHQWRYARLDRGNELAAPLLLTLAGGARLGVAGEIFAPGGGLAAAWASGNALARRLLQVSP
jgi:predicted NAD/FAD-dependent oxidoreductase